MRCDFVPLGPEYFIMVFLNLQSTALFSILIDSSQWKLSCSFKQTLIGNKMQEKIYTDHIRKKNNQIINYLLLIIIKNNFYIYCIIFPFNLLLRCFNLKNYWNKQGLFQYPSTRGRHHTIYSPMCLCAAHPGRATKTSFFSKPSTPTDTITPGWEALVFASTARGAINAIAPSCAMRAGGKRRCDNPPLRVCGGGGKLCNYEAGGFGLWLLSSVCSFVHPSGFHRRPFQRTTLLLPTLVWVEHSRHTEQRTGSLFTAHLEHYYKYYYQGYFWNLHYQNFYHNTYQLLVILTIGSAYLSIMIKKHIRLIFSTDLC